MNIVKEIVLMEEELEEVAIPILRRFCDETGCIIDGISIKNMDVTGLLYPVRKNTIGKLVCNVLIPPRS